MATNVPTFSVICRSLSLLFCRILSFLIYFFPNLNNLFIQMTDFQYAAGFDCYALSICFCVCVCLILSLSFFVLFYLVIFTMLIEFLGYFLLVFRAQHIILKLLFLFIRFIFYSFQYRNINMLGGLNTMEIL